MKKFTLFFVAALFAAVFSMNQTHAQPTEPAGMYFIMEEFVAPADMAEFWKVQSEGLKMFDQLGFKMNYGAFHTDHSSFYWAVPIKNFASIDTFYAQWMEQTKAMKEAGWDPEAKFRDLSNISQFVVVRNKDLSYQPAEQAADAPMPKFWEWTFMYLKAGHEKEAADAIQQYIDFTKKEGINYYWDIYQVVLGQHTPCWVLETSADSEEQLRHLENELDAKYKDDYRKLWQNFAKHVRAMETTKGWFLPDWSRHSEE